MPLFAVLYVLSVFEILSAVIEAVLEREPGNMIVLYVELNLKLPDP